MAEQDAAPELLLGAGWRPSEGPLSFELAWGFSSSVATSFETVEASLFLHQFEVAALYHLPLSERWRPFGRVGAALDLGRLRIDHQERSWGDTALGLGLEATAGMELAVPFHTADIGFTVEAGWSLHPFGLEFDDLRPDRDDEARPAPIADGPIAAGGVDPGGPILRFGMVLHF